MTDVASIKAFYDARHKAKGAFAWRPPEAYRAFLDALPLRPGGTLLDVGCGSGHLLAEASRRGLETYGIDLSEEGVKVARQISPHSAVSVAAGEALPFPDGRFDYVVSTGSLEHFLDIGAGVREMARAAKPGGHLLIVVPNAGYFLTRLGRFAGTEQRAIREAVFPLEKWRSYFKAAGLVERHVGKDFWPLVSLQILKAPSLLSSLRRALYAALFILLPVRFTYQFVFLLQKPS